MMSEMSESARTPYLEKFGKMSPNCLFSPTTATIGFRSVPSTYIKTTKDGLLVPVFQEALVQQAIQSSAAFQGEGPGDGKAKRDGLVPFSDEVVGRLDVESDHISFLSSPGDVAGLLVRVAERAKALA